MLTLTFILSHYTSDTYNRNAVNQPELLNNNQVIETFPTGIESKSIKKGVIYRTESDQTSLLHNTTSLSIL